MHLLREITLYVCSCKYNQVPTAHLKLTEGEKRFDGSNQPQDYKPPLWTAVKKKSAIQGVIVKVFAFQ